MNINVCLNPRGQVVLAEHQWAPMKHKEAQQLFELGFAIAGQLSDLGKVIETIKIGVLLEQTPQLAKKKDFYRGLSITVIVVPSGNSNDKDRFRCDWQSDGEESQDYKEDPNYGAEKISDEIRGQILRECRLKLERWITLADKTTTDPEVDGSDYLLAIDKYLPDK